MTLRVADRSTPVVVLRSFHHGGLGVVRSLGRLGIPVWVVDSDPWAPSFSSRYCRGKFVWDLDRASDGDSIDYLVRLARKLGRPPVLIHTSDIGAVFIAENAAELRNHFLFPGQPPHLPEALCNKKSMYYLARRSGVPTPDTFFPQSKQDALNFASSARFPIIVKPIVDKKDRNGAKGAKAIVTSAHDLMEKYAAMENPDCPNLILQEYIPGGAGANWMFNGYFNENSECLFGFTGRKIRQSPTYTGATSLGLCVGNETVEQTTRNFMKSIGYCGILDLGYHYDARDGLYKVFDVNPRIGSAFRLFVSDTGMDVARALYLDLTHQPIPAGGHVPGRKWTVEDRDLVSSFHYWRDGNLGLGEWLRSFRGIQETAFLSFDDPLPILSMCVNDVREFLRRSRKPETPIREGAASRRNGTLAF